MVEMTKRERVLRTVRFQETDRIPVYDLLSQDAILEHAIGGRVTPANAWRATYRAIRDDLDMTRAIHIPRFEETDAELDEGFIWHFERHTMWLRERPFRDIAGLVAWIHRDIDRRRRWRPDRTFVESWRAEITKHQDGIGDDTVVVMESDVGLETARDAAGIELFSYLAMDEPALLSEWLDALNDSEVRRAHAVADPVLVPIVLTYTDIAYKNGLIHSPDFLRREFIPRLKRLNNAWQEHGVICLFHSDGNLMEIMDDLVAADIQGINPMETIAGMSISEVRRRYGDRLFITGGVDVSQLMAFGTPDEVRARCEQAIREAEGVGYFLGSTTELGPQVRLENILAMVDVARGSYG